MKEFWWFKGIPRIFRKDLLGMVYAMTADKMNKVLKIHDHIEKKIKIEEMIIINYRVRRL
jgi:hypothetical protein